MDNDLTTYFKIYTFTIIYCQCCHIYGGWNWEGPLNFEVRKAVNVGYSTAYKYECITMNNSYARTIHSSMCQPFDGSYDSPGSHCGVDSMMIHSRIVNRPRSSQAQLGTGCIVTHQTDDTRWSTLGAYIIDIN